MRYVVGLVAALFVVGYFLPNEEPTKPETSSSVAAPADDAAQPEPTSSESAEATESTDAEPEPTPTPSASPTTDPTRDADDDADRGTAVVALAALAVKGRAPMTGYARDRFGQAWLDADRNGCDTRNDVLAEHLTQVVLKANSCRVQTGVYADPYTGDRIDYRYGHGHLIDVDHVVAMGNSWATGASRWGIKKRAAFANDPLNLLPAGAWANRQKGDSDAASWLPPNRGFRCAYVARQVAVKQKYGLWVTAPEKAAIGRVLASCPGQPITPDPWKAPTRVDHNITDPGAPGERSKPKPKGPRTKGPRTLIGGGQNVHYENCTAARDAGAAPVRRGDPGYGRHLDRDGDGVGCE